MSLFGQQNTQQSSLFGGLQAQQPQPSSGAQASGLFAPTKSLFGPASGQQPQQAQASIFGSTGTASIFGQPPTQNPQQKSGFPAAGSLFSGLNQQSQPQTAQFGLPGQALTSCFNSQPQNQSAFPTQQQSNIFQDKSPAPQGLFNQTQVQQQQQQQEQSTNQNNQSSLSGFYQIKKIWSPEMIQKLYQSMTLNQEHVNHLQTTISAKNQWINRNLADLDKKDEAIKQAQLIETTFEKQIKDVEDAHLCLISAQKGILELDQQIQSAQNYLIHINSSQQQFQFQILSIRSQLERLSQFRKDLNSQINIHQSQDGEIYQSIQVPSEYFFKLQNHHQQLLEQLDQMVTKVQAAVNQIHQEMQEKSDMLDKNQRLSFQDIKKQVFEVCQLIYDQQRLTASQLNQIDRKVAKLKHEFIQKLARSKGYLHSEKDLEAIFEKQKEDGSLFNLEVMQKMKQIKDSNITSQLLTQLVKMDLDNKLKIEKEPDSQEQKQLYQLLKERFGKNDEKKESEKIQEQKTGLLKFPQSFQKQIQGQKGEQSNYFFINKGINQQNKLGKRQEDVQTYFHQLNGQKYFKKESQESELKFKYKNQLI